MLGYNIFIFHSANSTDHSDSEIGPVPLQTQGDKQMSPRGWSQSGRECHTKEKPLEGDSSAIIPKPYRQLGWTQTNNARRRRKIGQCKQSQAGRMKVLWWPITISSRHVWNGRLQERLLLEPNPAMETCASTPGGSCGSSLKHDLVPTGALGTFFMAPPITEESIILFMHMDLTSNRCKAFIRSYKPNSLDKEIPGISFPSHWENEEVK